MPLFVAFTFLERKIVAFLGESSKAASTPINSFLHVGVWAIRAGGPAIHRLIEDWFEIEAGHSVAPLDILIFKKVLDYR